MIEPTIAKYYEMMCHEFLNNLFSLLEKQDLSEEEMENVYALGYNHFICGNYNKARDVFIKLASFAPSKAYYWRALGAVNQQMKKYDEAIGSYDKAIANDSMELISYIYRAETKILSGNQEAGISDLNQAIKIGTGQQKWNIWVNRAKLLLNKHKNLDTT